MSFDSTIRNINNGLNSFGNTVGQVTQQSVQLGQSLNGLNNALNGMPTDTYTPGSTAPAQDGKVPLPSLFTDQGNYMPDPLEQKFADKLHTWGWLFNGFKSVNTSEDFVNAASTPFKRNMMSYLMGFGAEKTYIGQKINDWAGQADLIRTGVSVNDAKLMQITGVRDSTHLQSYGNPIHKTALYSAMAANALQYGLYLPNINTISTAIDNSRTLTPILIR